VASLFSKRGYNIDTLQVAPMAEDPTCSRIIMTSSGTEATREQIIHQLEKLSVVREVRLI
jgi:acetolactate synthase-1/3 small subunit